jgi:IS30 family transposase
VPARAAPALRRVASSSARNPKLTELRKREAIRRRDRDEEPVREIARSYNVPHRTISKLVE